MDPTRFSYNDHTCGLGLNICTSVCGELSGDTGYVRLNAGVFLGSFDIKPCRETNESESESESGFRNKVRLFRNAAKRAHNVPGLVSDFRRGSSAVSELQIAWIACFFDF